MVKVKAGDNFNHRNTFSILKIAASLRAKFESNAKDRPE
uniref:Uncharacterized protein n=1 Tax=uncultured Desulfobacterium sp. TaxID=201089 RepID=E1YGG2_9BACT|nr:unknown protein [uncultured Desulfobacterium sp.]